MLGKRKRIKKTSSMLYAAQIRAARALLGWRQEDLAKAAKVGLATLARIEQGQGVVQGNFSTVMKIQRALEKEGISFNENQDGGIGVFLEKKPRRR
jgi:transcriptional regulator with XRE-family HTH domain